VCEGLKKKGTRGRTVGLKLRYADWTNITRARTIPEPTNDTTHVTALALTLLRENAPDRPVRLIGVRMASFEEGAGGRPGLGLERQLSLPV
jgi:DNA polymerase-4